MPQTNFRVIKVELKTIKIIFKNADIFYFKLKIISMKPSDNTERPTLTTTGRIYLIFSRTN